MVFSSTIFIFFFLPIFLVIYYLSPDRFKNLVILLGGYFFYAWGAPRFAFLLLGSIMVDYLLSLVIFNCKFGRWAQQLSAKRGVPVFYQQLPKILLVVSVVMNIGLLAYFKYSNFFVDQFNVLLHMGGATGFNWVPVILPIGISFTVFQELSYIIEIYRGNLKPARSLIDFAAYLMLFPHVIAGPIVRYSDIATELQSRHHSWENLGYGFYRFSLGLAKKVLLANYLGALADKIFNLAATSSLPSYYYWWGIAAYALQIYFDFSGYSDMAIGLARLLGFHFKENFNYPYIAQSVTDFWRRWHISLTTWMREYVYIPLGGNRISPGRTYFNLWLVFLLSGLWHGAGWNFIIWGALHGLFLTLDRLFWLKLSNRWAKWVKIIFTFFLINLSWVFFRLDNLVQAGNYLKNLFNPSGWSVKFTNLSGQAVYTNRQLAVFVLALVISFFPATNLFAYCSKFWLKRSGRLRLTVKYAGSLALLLLSLMSMLNSQFNPFIYFRF
jgi:alginate O-acetyltransferase complex protein AlgI